MKRLTLIALMFLFGFCAVLIAQDSYHVEKVNEIPFHWVLSTVDFTISGDYAYLLGYNCGLSIIDISNISNPIKVGYLGFEEYTSQVEIHDNYLYISNYYDTVFIVDISDPANPEVVNSLPFEYERVSIKIQDGLLYAINGSYYPDFMVYDLSNPLQPELISSIDLYGHITILDVSNGIVFLNKISYGLILIDARNPLQLEVIYNLDLNESVKDVAIQDDLVCLVDPDSLYMIDISELDEPEMLGSIELNCRSISILDNRLYICRYDGIAVMDITDPSTPETISTFEMENGCDRMIILDGYGYVESYGVGFGVVNLHNGNSISWVGGYHEKGKLVCFDTHDDYIYCVDDNLGLVVMRVNDVNNIELVSSNAAYTEGIMMTIADNYLYLVTSTECYPSDYYVYTFDLSNPASPVDVNCMGPFDYSTDIDACGSYLYLAGYDDSDCAVGFAIFDFSNPEAPEFVGSYTGSSGRAGISIEVLDDYAYFSDYYGGLHVVDVSNPAQPVFLGNSSLEYAYYDLVLSGEHVFAITYTEDEWDNGEYSTNVIAVNDPYNPAYLSTYDIQASKISASEDFYCAARNTLWVVNASDPANPFESGHYELMNICLDIKCYENYVYLLDEKSFMIFDIEAAVENDDSEVVEAYTTVQLSNYPNPFNPETTIAFSLPQDGNVCIKVYNARGQLVKTLFDSNMSAGDHEIVWNGKDEMNRQVGSGIYFCQMQTTDKTLNRKLLMMK